MAQTPAGAVDCANSTFISHYNGWYTYPGPGTQYVTGVSATITVRNGDVCENGSPPTGFHDYDAAWAMVGAPLDGLGYAQSGYNNTVGGATYPADFAQSFRGGSAGLSSNFTTTAPGIGNKPVYKTVYSTSCTGGPSACLKMYSGSTQLLQTPFNPTLFWTTGLWSPIYEGESGNYNSLTPGDTASLPAVFSSIKIQASGGNLQDFTPSSHTDSTSPQTNTTYDHHSTPGTCFDGSQCFSIWH